MRMPVASGRSRTILAMRLAHSRGSPATTNWSHMSSVIIAASSSGNSGWLHMSHRVRSASTTDGGTLNSAGVRQSRRPLEYFSAPAIHRIASAARRRPGRRALSRAPAGPPRPFASGGDAPRNRDVDLEVVACPPAPHRALLHGGEIIAVVRDVDEPRREMDDIGNLTRQAQHSSSTSSYQNGYVGV